MLEDTRTIWIICYSRLKDKPDDKLCLVITINLLTATHLLLFISIHLLVYFSRDFMYEATFSFAMRVSDCLASGGNPWIFGIKILVNVVKDSTLDWRHLTHEHDVCYVGCLAKLEPPASGSSFPKLRRNMSPRHQKVKFFKTFW